jgi:predicted amidophosphoribosyltransferase
VLTWLSGRLAHLLVPPPGAVVTWAPTSNRRRRPRGFDQAELLARAVARHWSAPCHRLLSRRAGPPQTGRSLADRRVGPLFLARAGARVAAGAPVVVVDDVVTTGTTMAAAARALLVVDVGPVGGLAAARTPWHDAAPPCVLPSPQKVQLFAQVAAATGR